MSWILFQQRRQIFRSVIANGSGTGHAVSGIEVDSSHQGARPYLTGL